MVILVTKITLGSGRHAGRPLLLTNFKLFNSFFITDFGKVFLIGEHFI